MQGSIFHSLGQSEYNFEDVGKLWLIDPVEDKVNQAALRFLYSQAKSLNR